MIKIILMTLLFSIFLTDSCQENNPFKDYSCALEQSIAEGNFGKVFLLNKSSKHFALKVMESNDMTLNEYKILSKLKGSPFVVDIIDKKFMNKKSYFILEYCEFGSLKNFLKVDNYLKDENNVFILFEKLTRGLKEIHEAKIIHADVKLENIVVNKDFSPKFIDFNMSIANKELEVSRGTLKYMAPELLSSNILVFDEKMDVYALGVVLYYISQNKYPFNDTESQSEYLESVKRGIIEIKPNTSLQMINLIDSLIKFDPKERLSTEGILQLLKLIGKQKRNYTTEPVFLDLYKPTYPNILRKIPNQNFIDIFVVMALFVLIGFTLTVVVIKFIKWRKQKRIDLEEAESNGITLRI